MNVKQIYKSMTITKELINSLENYSLLMDKFFKNEENKILHQEIYKYYQLLNKDLKGILRKVNY